MGREENGETETNTWQLPSRPGTCQTVQLGTLQVDHDAAPASENFSTISLSSASLSDLSRVSKLGSSQTFGGLGGKPTTTTRRRGRGKETSSLSPDQRQTAPISGPRSATKRAHSNLQCIRSQSSAIARRNRRLSDFYTAGLCL